MQDALFAGRTQVHSEVREPNESRLSDLLLTVLCCHALACLTRIESVVPLVYAFLFELVLCALCALSALNVCVCVRVMCTSVTVSYKLTDHLCII